MNRNWKIKAKFDGAVMKRKNQGVNPLVSRILELRGIEGPAAQRAFLTAASLEQLSDPWLLPDMDQAVERLLAAVEEQQQIVVYGDYDVDGMTATAILLKALRHFGAKADYYIPHRLHEGYGLNKEALAGLKLRGADLVVTVDCGISCAEEAEYAKEIGLTLLITDHHQAPEVLPDTPVLMNPVLMENPGPKKGLAGAGVAFLLSWCLAESIGAAEEITDLVELAAIGTVADVVPLTGDNRLLVMEGLKRLNKSPSCGLGALIGVSGLEEKEISTGHIAFALSPRLNAAGRMDRPGEGLELLLAEDPAQAALQAEKLDGINRLRQETESRIMEEAEKVLQENPELPEEPILVVAGRSWHQGVIGVVASRLMERYHKPSLLISLEDGKGKGSGRSVPGFSLYDALTYAAPALLAYGGHPMACGFSLTEDALPEFRRLIGEYGRRYLECGPVEKIVEGDLELTAGDLTIENAEAIRQLAPFGQGNPQPLFAMEGVFLQEIQPLGKEGKHYRLALQPREGTAGRRAFGLYPPVFKGLLFNVDQSLPLPVQGRKYDILFTLEVNIWQNRKGLQLILREIQEAQKETLAPADPSAGHRGSGDFAVPEEVRRQILGQREYRAKQLEAVAALQEGKNTLLVMATGRGKTAVFQTAAALQPKDAVSIILYPLRSLAAEQVSRMRAALGPLGLDTALAWGGLNHWEKREFFKNLYQGRHQVVVTTAEFLEANLAMFMPAASRIRLFVVDEAHHLSSGERQSYRHLHQIWRQLGCPRFFGATATANSACTGEIVRNFEIGELITEDFCRKNLELADGRQAQDKLDYILGQAKEAEKAVVYVNSRAMTEKVAAALADRAPELAGHIAGYHGGLESRRRLELEDAFRQGRLQMLVSTSAFGEGADLPDIRHVFLYHLCFSRAEYNQLSGRAGRDGEPARVHLLYQKEDEALNRRLLRTGAPDRAALGAFYLYLKELKCRAKGGGKAYGGLPLDVADEELAAGLAARGLEFSTETVETGLTIFEELELILREWQGERRLIHLAPPPPAKLDLTNSALFRESSQEVLAFEDYLGLAWSRDPEELLAGINRPILP